MGPVVVAVAEDVVAVDVVEPAPPLEAVVEPVDADGVVVVVVVVVAVVPAPAPAY